MGKRIIVLGAGYGGILTAKKLANKFKSDNDMEIMLIDKNPYHTMRTELHEIAANRVEETSIRIDLKKVFNRRNVEVVLDEITEMDFKKQILKSNKRKYNYDYLVVGTGSKPAFFGIDGAEEHSYTLWTYEDAVKIKEQILNMFRNAAKETDVEKRKNMLSFVVVGGGFTGVEMMGELGEWKDRLCTNFHIDKSEVSLYLVDALPSILPIYPENLRKKAERKFVELGVRVRTGSGITQVTGNSVKLASGQEIKADTVIWTAGVQGSTIIENTDVEKQGRGRIVTNQYLQAEGYSNVFVVGDNIFYTVEGQERPVPQMVENAEHSAPLVAKNIHRSVKKKELKSYKASFHGSMVCIGSKYGLAHLGLPGKFFGLTGFLAMFCKHFINLVYFIQVAGINKCWSYLLHEFVYVDDNRSFLGGHLSKKAPSIWLTPLRIMMGITLFNYGFENNHLIEMILGIFLSIGLFTTLSSLVGIVLVIIGSTQAFGSSIMAVGGFIALMASSGSSLGLDYYFLDSIKKAWKSIGFINKYYLYVD